MSRKPKAGFWGVLLLASALFLAGCSGEPPVKSVTLVAEDIHWDIEQISAQLGQTVEVTLRNDGALDHSFVIEQWEISVHLSPGETQVVSFVADSSGTYKYICGIPGHEDAGMVGELVVTE